MRSLGATLFDRANYKGFASVVYKHRKIDGVTQICSKVAWLLLRITNPFDQSMRKVSLLPCLKVCTDHDIIR